MSEETIGVTGNSALCGRRDSLCDIAHCRLLLTVGVLPLQLVFYGCPVAARRRSKTVSRSSYKSSSILWV